MNRLFRPLSKLLLNDRLNDFECYFMLLLLLSLASAKRAGLTRRNVHKTADHEFEKLMHIIKEYKGTDPVDRPLSMAEQIRKRNLESIQAADALIPEFAAARKDRREKNTRDVVREQVEKLLMDRGVDESLFDDLASLPELLDRAKDARKNIRKINAKLARANPNT